MTDKITTVAEIKRHIQDFSDARGWRKDQNAKDLVMALTVEAAELAEILDAVALLHLILVAGESAINCCRISVLHL